MTVGKHAALEGKALAIVSVQLALSAASAVQRHHNRVRVILITRQPCVCALNLQTEGKFSPCSSMATR